MVHNHLMIEHDSEENNHHFYYYLPELKANLKLWYENDKLKELGMFIDSDVFFIKEK